MVTKIRFLWSSRKIKEALYTASYVSVDLLLVVMETCLALTLSRKKSKSVSSF